MEKKRYEWIDIARGIVIISVIIGHADCPSLMHKGIYGFHIPFFFILSGFLYNSEKWKQKGIKELIKNKWKSYVIPYFVLSFVNLFINIPVEYLGNEKIRGKELLFSTIKHFFWIFYSPNDNGKVPNCIPLWFLLCMFVSYVFVYFMMKYNSSVRMLICFLAMVTDFAIFKFVPYPLPWHLGTALMGMTFMYAGFLIKEYNILDKINIYLILCLFVLGFYSIYVNDEISMNNNRLQNIVLLLVGSVSVSMAIMGFCCKYLKKSVLLAKLGKNTILIMGFNCAINSYCRGVFGHLFKINITWWELTLINIILFYLLIFIWDMIKRRHPKCAIF